MDESGREFELSGTSLDEWDVRKCHLLKGDNEGVKTRVLAGAVNTIDKNRHSRTSRITTGIPRQYG